MVQNVLEAISTSETGQCKHFYTVVNILSNGTILHSMNAEDALNIMVGCYKNDPSIQIWVWIFSACSQKVKIQLESFASSHRRSIFLVSIKRLFLEWNDSKSLNKLEINAVQYYTNSPVRCSMCNIWWMLLTNLPGDSMTASLIATLINLWRLTGNIKWLYLSGTNCSCNLYLCKSYASINNIPPNIDPFCFNLFL